MELYIHTLTYLQAVLTAKLGGLRECGWPYLGRPYIGQPTVLLLLYKNEIPHWYYPLETQPISLGGTQTNDTWI